MCKHSSNTNLLYLVWDRPEGNFNNIISSLFKLRAKDQVNIFLYSYSSNNPISLSQDIINLVINFLNFIVINSTSARALDIFFRIFVLSDSVKFNFCKFSVAYITGCLIYRLVFI